MAASTLLLQTAAAAALLVSFSSNTHLVEAKTLFPQKNSVPFQRFSGEGRDRRATATQDRVEAVGLLIGGTVAQRAQPWMASLQWRTDKTFKHYCGGSYVGGGWVLTAAHCVEVFNSVCFNGMNLLDQSTYQCYPVSRAVSHPKWNSMTYENDIMMVKIKGDYDGRPILLNDDSDLEAVDRSLSVDGWGETSSGDMMGGEDGTPINGPIAGVNETTYKMHTITLKVISNEDCSVWGGNIPAELPYSMMCTSGAGGIGTCMGDSGGPLYAVKDVNTFVVGVVSFGSKQCDKGLPTVYTRVSEYGDWIRQTIRDQIPPLPGIELPQECDHTCKVVRGNTSDDNIETIPLVLPAAHSLKGVLWLQSDKQVQLMVLDNERKLGSIKGSYNKWSTYEDDTCLPAGVYNLRVVMDKWRIIQYDAFQVLIVKPPTNASCDPYPELKPLPALAPPTACQDPTACQVYSGNTSTGSLASIQLQSPAKVFVWFQAYGKYDLNLVLNDHLEDYVVGDPQSWQTLDNTTCHMAGTYALNLEREDLASEDSTYKMYVLKVPHSCTDPQGFANDPQDNTTSTDAQQTSVYVQATSTATELQVSLLILAASLLANSQL
eukprot:comp22519_c1_seq1/m.34131 comp22519_c1_seq1/g.34131  ORF comp22519_c1_seq1/g.34131 comp22519_c1_seq1/m.34131 type:complete len:603 (-) comp22519_c1_seq1:306-2114(-)